MFVYLTCCLINNKKYIGKYEGSEKDNYLGSGKLLKRAIEKYGKENFERMILERYTTKEECREGEKKWIARFDAVKSKEFYNIAEGGEGGNTFAGIQGEERIQLIAKLKNRKRPRSKQGTTICWDAKLKVKKTVSTEEFQKDKFLFGNTCKGIYITPCGVFTSSAIAAQYNKLDGTSLIKRCKNNQNVVKKSHLSRDKSLNLSDLGKNFSNLGYAFVPLVEITEEFINQNNIIKK